MNYESIYQFGFPYPIRTYFDWISTEFSYNTKEQKLLDIGYLLTKGYDVRADIHHVYQKDSSSVSEHDVRRTLNILLAELWRTRLGTIESMHQYWSTDRIIDELFSNLLRYYHLPVNNMKPHYLKNPSEQTELDRKLTNNHSRMGLKQMSAESRCAVSKPLIPITIEGYDVKIFTDNIEDSALEQIKELLSIDVFSDKKIRIMPDVHAGAGCVIGFTGNLGDKVIPNIVGVDIGCGMRVLKLGKIRNINFHAFHEHILGNVPSGKTVREDRSGFKPLIAEEMEIYREAKKIVTELYCYRMLKDSGRINKSIGSLGGGNHFIELDKDDDNNVYLVIHTGSRNLGKQVADIWQTRAIQHLTDGADEFEETIKRTIEEYKATGRRKELQSVIKKMRREHEKAAPTLPSALCYVEGEAREQYLHDMRLCQQWAVLNRKLIASLLIRFFPDTKVEEEWESVHNYISHDNLIRKGSISAAEGEKCIIPLNMRDGSLICTGKGNPDWNYSAPHGAGRVLSRTQAYEKITMANFKESMRGIYSESVNDFTRDEAPMVYKPASDIIANIDDTVTIDTIIRPIFNFKAS